MTFNSLMNTALSGLSSAQFSMDTASNNVANYKTPGYNRQNVILTENVASKLAPGFIGNGVLATRVNRAYSEFVVGQLRDSQQQGSELGELRQQISQIDDLLAARTTDISATMQQFFTAFENVVSNATDNSARQTVLGQAGDMVARFNSANRYFQQLDTGVNQKVTDGVTQANNYASEIAKLNSQITQLRGSTGAEPNALLDQRDELVSELNKVIGVKAVQQDGKTYNISFGGGLSLVQGDTAYKLVAIPSSSDPSRLTVAYDPGNGTPFEVAESTISGFMGGAMRFRTEGLDGARNQLGQLALVLIDNINKVNTQGFDIYDNQGGLFFTAGGIGVVSNTRNTGSAVLTAAYGTTATNNTSDVKASDYKFQFNGTDWKVTRLSDKVVLPSTTMPMTLDGMEITLTGVAATNDSFIVRPVSAVSTNFTLVINDPGKIAAAAEDMTTADGGKSDNRNAQKFLDLQTQNLVERKTTFTGAYASLVSKVGTQTVTAKANNTAQESITAQLAASQQAISGVNLDEEYINIQQFQQWYVANTKSIDASSVMFSALMGIRA